MTKLSKKVLAIMLVLSGYVMGYYTPASNRISTANAIARVTEDNVVSYQRDTMYITIWKNKLYEKDIDNLQAIARCYPVILVLETFNY